MTRYGGVGVISMTCCTGYCAAETQFDGKRAEQDLRRYRRHGADITTRLLLEELRRQPMKGRRLLDVGGGIGVISAELADTGVASVTMVEASPAYLEVARREIGSRYGSRPTQFILGDFAAVADTVPKADVVTLDRVVCCYPDGEALLRNAAERTLHLLAFTYPRNRWYVRMMIALENFWRRLTGNEFRAFVHPPQRMEAALAAAGLVCDTRRETFGYSNSMAGKASDDKGSQRRADMQKRVVLVVLVQMLLATSAFNANTKLSAFQFFVGHWQGTVQGEPGSGTVEREYEFVMNDTFIRVRNKSIYPPQEKNPKGETHEDFGLFSYDGNRKKHVLRQFHVEGFVNQYVEDTFAPDGKKMVFVTEAIENIPAGWRARETYHILNDNEFSERFELAAPGEDFKLYSESALKRAKVGKAD